MVPLKAICILERAETNSITELTFKEAFPILLQQTYRPKDVTKMNVNNFAEDAFETSYKAMV